MFCTPVRIAYSTLLYLSFLCCHFQFPHHDHALLPGTSYYKKMGQSLRMGWSLCSSSLGHDHDGHWYCPQGGANTGGDEGLVIECWHYGHLLVFSGWLIPHLHHDDIITHGYPVFQNVAEYRPVGWPSWLFLVVVLQITPGGFICVGDGMAHYC
jgi:hypothetical protein